MAKRRCCFRGHASNLWTSPAKSGEWRCYAGRVRRALAVGTLALSACTAVDVDLLGPAASACALGAAGSSDDITPPEVPSTGANPGVRDLVIDPFDRSVLYASTYEHGVWRTADCGATWTHANIGINAPMIENSIPMGIAIDPFVPDTLYLGARYGGQSLWTTDNAGVHWAKILPADVAMPLWNGEADIGRVATLPDEPYHLIAASVPAWAGYGGDSGVIEGRRDADGTWRWTAHPPVPGMRTQQELAVLDARTWLVVASASPGGAWLTRDAGATFAQVDDDASTGDGFQLYRAANGAWYRPATVGLLRSTDDGATWTDVFAGLGLGGTRSVIGDGTRIYASSSIPDGDAVVRLFSAPEDPGDRAWVRVGDPSTHSVTRFVRDELRDVLYTLTGDGAVRRTVGAR